MMGPSKKPPKTYYLPFLLKVVKGPLPFYHQIILQLCGFWTELYFDISKYILILKNTANQEIKWKVADSQTSCSTKNFNPKIQYSPILGR